MKSAITYKQYKNQAGLLVLLPDEIFELIKKHISVHYPKEYGGVFVGKVEGTVAIIEMTMVSRQYYNTPVLFRRFSRFINKCLYRVFAQSKGDVIYLGEWHSHPNGKPNPSGTDINAMKNIAESKSVRIQTPLLMIVAYDGQIFNEQFYFFSCDKLIPYQKIIQQEEGA